MDFVVTLLALVVLLMVVSFVYDLGQILVARWSGVRTRWRFWYVELPGEFHAKPLTVRSAIVAAGPIANLLLATLLFTFTWSQVGFVYVSGARVDGLVPGGSAARAGFQVGDRVISVNGRMVESFSDMVRMVSNSADIELSFEVERGGGVTRLSATPDRRKIADIIVRVMGIHRSAVQPDSEYKRLRPVEYVPMAVKNSYWSSGGCSNLPRGQDSTNTSLRKMIQAYMTALPNRDLGEPWWASSPSSP